MRTHFLYMLVGLLFMCTSSQTFAQAKDPTTRGAILPQTAAQQNNSKSTNAVNYATKAEKYAADGLTAPGSKTKGKSSVKNNSNNATLPYNNTIPTQNSAAPNIERCGTDAHIANRTPSNQERQLIKELREAAADKIASFIPCDGSNSIVIPIAIHYDASFTCANTQCLIDAAVNSIDKLNDDFAALNADISYYNTLNAACPEGYPLDVVSDGTCMQFCLATQNHPAAENIADGQPAITVGQYTWSGGPDAPNFAGYLNIFVEANTGGLGIAAAPGLGNGDGVQVDASTWGGAGFASCASGSSLNTDATYNLGRTFTHELGHYFDLFHTFQGGCPDGDTGTFSGQVGVVNDTPGTANPFFGCPTVTSCANAPASGCASQYAQITNYMDYTDDACMVMFTQDQAAVMNGWANSLSFVSDATVCSAPMSLTSLAACSLTALFSPADGSEIAICTDDGTTIQFADLSTNGPVSWDWTFTVTGGDITLSSGVSTMQNPAPMVTAGTSGTLQVDLVVMDVNGIVETATQNYTVTVLSGDACPNECEYTLNLTDDFGDGWNGATVEVFQGGVSLGVFGGAFTTGTNDGPYTLTLTDGLTIDIIQTNGGFFDEEGFTLVSPFGFTAAQLVDGAPLNQSFTASCSMPTCDDGIQNGDETGVDCGGSICGDCCGNGIQDADETGVDCGGAICAPCPSCPADFTEILNETFDGCAQPAGWTVSSTGTSTVANGDFSFSAAPGDVPPGGTVGPPADFAGCIALIDDDNDAGSVGIHCIVTPVIDITAFINTSLTYDWQHEELGGSTFNVEVYDGTNWVNVFTSAVDANGNNETANLDTYANAAFQVRFCYDDAGGWNWGAGIDNVSICGQPNDTCPTDITTNDVSGDYCDGTTAMVTASSNPNVTYAWSSDNANVQLVDAAAASTSVELSALTACTIETANISLVATCIIDDIELFNGVVSTVNVYPAAPATPADLEALLTLNEGTCMDPVTVSVGCEDFVVLAPDAANPNFPVNPGDAGTASYTATYTTTPDCCPDVSGSTVDIIVDGGFESGAAGNGWTEFSDEPFAVIDPTFPLTGTTSAWLGGIAAGITNVQQTVSISPTAAAADLSFNIAAGQCDCAGGDDMQVLINGTVVWSLCNPLAGQVQSEATICNGLTDPATTFVSSGPIDVIAFADGTPYVLEINTFEAADDGTNTSIFVDDVELIVEQAAGEDPCTVTVSGNYECAESCTLTASTIATTDLTRICIDGMADPIDVTVDVEGGGTGVWVITDANGIVLALPAGPPFDLDGAGAGQCLIWYANIDDDAFVLDEGDDAAAAIAASSCAFLSNPITVDRIEVTAPVISTTSNTDICTGDGVADMIDVTVDDAGIGAASAWVITDANGMVLALPPTGPPFDLEGAGAGTCLIWLANIDDPNFTIAVGDDAGALIADATCAALSNPITITRAADCAPMVSISDPCNCENGIDLSGNGVNDILVETITIMPGTAPYTVTAYSDLATTGLVDMVGNAYSDAAVYPDGAAALEALIVNNPDGTATISVYIPADGISVFSIEITDANGATSSFIKDTPCTSCAPAEQVPTVGEWGLIILGLMMSIVAIVGIRERRKVYA